MQRDNLRSLLGIEEQYDIDTIIAFGYADEKAVSEAADGDIKYYRDENDIHRVPKRTSNELV